MLLTAGHGMFQLKGETQVQADLGPKRSKEWGLILNILQDSVSFTSLAAAATEQAEQGRALSKTPRTHIRQLRQLLQKAPSLQAESVQHPLLSHLCSSSSSSTVPTPWHLQPDLQPV